MQKIQSFSIAQEGQMEVVSKRSNFTFGLIVTFFMISSLLVGIWIGRLTVQSQGTTANKEQVQLIKDEINDPTKKQVQQKIEVSAQSLEKQAGKYFEKASTKEEIKEIIKAEIKEQIDQVKDSIEKQVTDTVKKQIKDEIKGEVQQYVKHQIQEDIRQSVKQSVTKDIKESIRNEVKKEIKSELKDEIKQSVKISAKQEVQASIKDQLKNQLKTQIQKSFLKTGLGSKENVNALEITYIWFGDKFPSTYMCVFEKVSFPYQIIMNPKIIKNFTRELKVSQISDLSKLEHIYYHGGIVSDFDNDINYECLMELLKDKKGAYMTGEADDTLSSFYYASEPFNPEVKRVLDGISEQNLLQWFSGSPVVIKSNITRIDLRACIRHKRDWSWRKDQGVAENAGWRSDWNNYINCTLKNKF